MLLGVEAEQKEQPTLSEQPTIQQMHQEAIRVRGGREIALDEECCKIAQRWANHMARTGMFGHGGGEQIIARGYPNVKACFSGWMNSSGHRAWVLSNSDRCGWGFQKSASGHSYWVGVFRRGAVEQAANDDKEAKSKTSG
jgi:uncharacterized protein YkwD